MARPPSKLAAVTAEVSQGIKSLGRASDDLSRRGRSAINGVFGGALCATLAYIASISYPGFNTAMFFTLTTLTGLAGGVAITRTFFGSASGSRASETALEANNAIFSELIERAQNPALLSAQKKLLLERAVAVSLDLGQAAPAVPATLPLDLTRPQLPRPSGSAASDDVAW